MRFKISLLIIPASIFISSITFAQQPLQQGVYSLYSKYIIILKKGDRLCYVGLHRQDASVDSIRKISNSNIYKIDSSNLVLIQESKKVLLYGDQANPNKYTLDSSTDWLKYLNQLSGQRLSLISPLKGFSHRTVEVFDKLQNAVFKLSLTGEARTPQ